MPGPVPLTPVVVIAPDESTCSNILGRGYAAGPRRIFPPLSKTYHGIGKGERSNTGNL